MNEQKQMERHEKFVQVGSKQQNLARSRYSSRTTRERGIIKTTRRCHPYKIKKRTISIQSISPPPEANVRSCALRSSLILKGSMPIAADFIPASPARSCLLRSRCSSLRVCQAAQKQQQDDSLTYIHCMRNAHSKHHVSLIN